MADDELVIEVDELDRALSYRRRAEAHAGGGILHRAFSVFLFDRGGRVLLQQRSRNKLLWPGYWSNSCCSHPRPGEETAAAARRRIEEELGVRADVRHLFKFQYHAEFEGRGAERELCSVLLSRTSAEVTPSDYEVQESRWVLPADLDDMLERAPSSFTPWLRLEWDSIRHAHAEDVRRFLQET